MPRKPRYQPQLDHDGDGVNGGSLPHQPVPAICPQPSRFTEREDGLWKVECVVHNVHLGDERQLNRGESDFVRPTLGEFLIGNGQVVRV